MSRRIDTGIAQPRDETEMLTAKGEKPLLLGKKEGEDYPGRLAKYIPAEIVGLYLTTTGMIPKNHDGTTKYTALWIVFALNFALVPVYFYFVTSKAGKNALWPQIILASIAFPVWVFAIGGPFQSFCWYQTWIASLTLSFVTVAMGFYKPRPGS